MYYFTYLNPVHKLRLPAERGIRLPWIQHTDDPSVSIGKNSQVLVVAKSVGGTATVALFLLAGSIHDIGGHAPYISVKQLFDMVIEKYIVPHDMRTKVLCKPGTEFKRYQEFARAVYPDNLRFTGKDPSDICESQDLISMYKRTRLSIDDVEVSTSPLYIGLKRDE